MTKQALPDLLDLAEAVASGALGADEAERQVRASLASDHDDAADRALLDLRRLIVATGAVRAHALATREAFGAAGPDLAHASGSIQTIVPGPVRAGAARRRSPRGGDSRAPRRTWLLVAATIAIGTGVVGASLVGGRLVAPNPVPTTPVAITSPTPDQASPSPAPAETSPFVAPKSAIFVFNKGVGSPAECGNDGRGGCIARLWAASLDGTSEHELLPDQSGCQRFQAWSPDGSQLLFSRSDCHVDTAFGGMTGTEQFYLTDASGSEPQLLDTGCVNPCLSEDYGAFSSDGRRVLFLRLKRMPSPPSATPDPVTGKPAEGSDVRVLTSMDLSTGLVTELGVFEAAYPSYPRWSPDRRQIVFDREIPLKGPQDHRTAASMVFVADADGRNIHQLSSSGSQPVWTPDGTRIVFQGERYRWIGSEARFFSDIYTIRPDGTDLRRLTTDEISSGPVLSVDGRIWFVRTPRVDGDMATEGPPQSWIMDADGSSATQSSVPPPPQDLAITAVQPTP